MNAIWDLQQSKSLENQGRDYTNISKYSKYILHKFFLENIFIKRFPRNESDIHDEGVLPLHHEMHKKWLSLIRGGPTRTCHVSRFPKSVFSKDLKEGSHSEQVKILHRIGMIHRSRIAHFGTRHSTAEKPKPSPELISQRTRKFLQKRQHAKSRGWGDSDTVDRFSSCACSDFHQAWRSVYHGSTI